MKKQDKIVFNTKFFTESKNLRVGISKEAAIIVNDIWLRTGIPAAEIVSKIIIESADRIEIQPSCFDSVLLAETEDNE